jgi:DNA polymerase-3 subunit delta'
MRFEEVIGHEELKEQLKKNIASGRISHATLFAGNIGSGILPLAMAYAAEVMSQHSENPEIARQNCDKLIHADMHFTYPVTTTQKVSKEPTSDHYVTEFRQAYLQNPYLSLLDWLNALGAEKKNPMINVYEASVISKTISLKSYEGGYKVIVIWLPEYLNASATNKLLKILEEPPAKTLFAIASEKPEELLPTFISRVQMVHVPPIRQEDLKAKLQESHGLEEAEAASIALVADGSYTQALELISESRGAQFKTDFRDWMRMLYAKKIYDIIPFTERLARESRPKQTLFLAYGLHIFRECLIMNYGSESLLRLDKTETDFVGKFAPFINAANALHMVQEFEQAAVDIGRNANGKILFLDLSLKVMKLIRVKPAA